MADESRGYHQVARESSGDNLNQWKVEQRLDSKSSQRHKPANVREEYSDVAVQNQQGIVNNRNQFGSFIKSGGDGSDGGVSVGRVMNNQYINATNPKKMLSNQSRKKKLNRTSTPGSMGLFNQQSARRQPKTMRIKANLHGSKKQ